MKSIKVTQKTVRTTEMVIGLNTQQTLCAKINTRGKDDSEIEIDITCADRSEQDLIEALLKKKRFKMSDDFSFVSRSANPGWSDHVILRGEKTEKMLKLICDTFEVKLPESNFYID